MADKVLVLGGAGFIGSHVAKALHRAGLTPVSYDNLRTGHDWAIQWGPLEQGDITDLRRLEAVVAKHRPVAAIHLAGLSAAGESVSKPGEYYFNNVTGMLCVLRVLEKYGVHRMVFSSSAAVYGSPTTMPITEDTPCAPINPYGASKLMGERLLADFHAAHGLSSISLRYFNACGADPEGDIGEVHSPETHLVPLVLEAAAGLRSSIKVFGDDYPTPDGTCIRDYVHVADLAQAHVLALRALNVMEGAYSFNLGNGQGYSVGEVIAAAARATHRPISIERCARRPGDPPALVADSAKARRILGWTPAFPEIERQIAHAWCWHLQYWADRHLLPAVDAA